MPGTMKAFEEAEDILKTQKALFSLVLTLVCRRFLHSPRLFTADDAQSEMLTLRASHPELCSLTNGLAQVMRLQGKGGIRPVCKPVPLEPFGHQVAGQASMLCVDATTLCKPLIPREHHLYRTLPPQLIPFTPCYKGVLHVQLEESEGGNLSLWGYYPDDNSPCPHTEEIDEGREDGHEDEHYLQPLQVDWGSGASTPLSSGSELDVPAAVELAQTSFPARPSSGCVVRVKEDEEYEVKAGNTATDKFLITTEEDSIPKAGKAREGSTKKQSTQSLNPWGLSLHTRLLDKMRKSAPSSSGCPFLVLENVVSQFVRPCILDLKVGSRLHGDDASQKKIASQSRKCNITTSRSLGLRLCGMQVYQETTGAYKNVDKYHGRTLTEDTFFDILRDFLHNGQMLRRELLAPILARLNALHRCLGELNSFRFYASSLLIMYDGQRPEHIEEHVADAVVGDSVEVSFSERELVNSSDTGTLHSSQTVPVAGSIGSAYCSGKASTDAVQGSSGGCEQRGRGHLGDNGNSLFSSSFSLVDVRMIDFAHTTHSGFHDDTVLHEGPDMDYMWGLQNLIGIFSHIQKTCC